MRAIYLTPAEAELVSGATSEGHALDPVQHLDGFILLESVLSDPFHASKYGFLAALPLIDYTFESEDDAP